MLLKTDDPAAMAEDRTLSMLDFQCLQDEVDHDSEEEEEEEGYYVGSMEEQDYNDEPASEHGYVPGQVQVVQEKKAENVLEHAFEDLKETVVKDFAKAFGDDDDEVEDGEDEVVEDDHHEIVKAKMKQLLAKEGVCSCCYCC